MQLSPQIVFRNMKQSDWIKNLVYKRLEKLESFCNNIIGCRVVIEIPHRHHHQGNLYSVRLDITVPDQEIVVNREASEHAAYQDINTALRDAFDSAKRQLEDYVRVKRQLVKRHESIPCGRIVQLSPAEGYGFLAAADGQEVYFHANSVLNEKFARLKVGMEVSFVEEQGEKGPQASRVKVVG